MPQKERKNAKMLPVTLTNQVFSKWMKNADGADELKVTWDKTPKLDLAKQRMARFENQLLDDIKVARRRAIKDGTYGRRAAINAQKRKAKARERKRKRGY